MPYAAITYRIKPGSDDALAELFESFQRVDTPALENESGESVGRLLGTAVFVKDEFMVRVIHYEGDFVAIARHMARQSGVHNLEEKLAPFLTHRKPASSPEEFQENFRNALMRCVSQLSVETHPTGN
ncbi:SchA/CurD-like domain-containing protein [Actinomadura roseirufa]|uniref:SchA/CurD-like domain-containing protein n=1 Tax=Actinomadura roseirufa TaxID=2094049 RepID=UPI001040FB3D|nr:SchA/CurD-like domain-containing protein [Actinomadura roseirufa]